MYSSGSSVEAMRVVARRISDESGMRRALFVRALLVCSLSAKLRKVRKVGVITNGRSVGVLLTPSLCHAIWRHFVLVVDKPTGQRARLGAVAHRVEHVRVPDEVHGQCGHALVDGMVEVVEKGAVVTHGRGHRGIRVVGGAVGKHRLHGGLLPPHRRHKVEPQPVEGGYSCRRVHAPR
eukprot:scaffold121832_cov63-Phaeocystis_antarctica.AAC.3